MLKNEEIQKCFDTITEATYYGHQFVRLMTNNEEFRSVALKMSEIIENDELYKGLKGG